MPIKKLFILFTSLLAVLSMVGQDSIHDQTHAHATIPKVTHYTTTDFKGDGQFWSMAQDEQGVLYFGNNDGALVFDGQRWHKVTLPNHSAVRSLVAATDGQIYAGGFNEIGVIVKDSLGQYTYASKINAFKIEHDNLGNLWQIHEFKGSIIYRSFKELVVLSNSSATYIKANHNFIKSNIVNDHFYVQDQDNGIFEFDPDSRSLRKVFDNTIHVGTIIAFLPSSEKSTVMVVNKAGNLYSADFETGQIMLWGTLFEPQQQEEVIDAVYYKGDYLIGTLSSGVMVVHENGKIENKSTTFSKLGNATVLALHTDRKNDRLWILLNNGIDLIEFDSPIAQLFGTASVYDIYFDEDMLYLATNTGVFYSTFDTGDFKNSTLDFKKIQDLEGQAWSIQKENGSLFIGHDKGLFQLKNGIPTRVGNTGGIWKIIAVSGLDDTYLAAGYDGLFPLKLDGSRWKLGNQIKGFDESSRDIMQIDDGLSFWICHGYKGVYRLKINPELDHVYALDHFTDQNGLQSPFNVNVTTYKSQIVFTSNTGVYDFNSRKNTFEPNITLNKILDPRSNTRKLLVTGTRTWFVQDDELGYFNPTENKPLLNKNLFLNLKGRLNRGMESIFPLNNDQVLIGATDGLFIYTIKSETPAQQPVTLLSAISTLSKSSEAFRAISIDREIRLEYQPALLRFEFTAPLLSPSSQKEFQYKLEGIDEDWSAWSTNAFKEYTYPTPGNYVFKVRSRNLMGQTAKEAVMSIFIPHPWYTTNLAYMLYALVFMGLIAIMVRWVNAKIEIERQKEKLAAQRSKKLLELEIEQLKLEQDKARIKKDKEVLEEDNLTKSKELANYTMLLVKKKEIFTDTYAALKEFKNSLKTVDARKRMQEVLLNLNQHRMGEEYLNVFDVHFEKTHEHFFMELRAIDPSISKRELRLCAFVKMNLTNKEIAPLLNISTRGVETARYRVRKKLNVDDPNFNNFLESLD